MVASGVVVINFGFLLVYILGSFTNWQVRVGSVNIDFFMALFCLLLNVHFAISNVFLDHRVSLEYISIVGIFRNLHNTRISSMVG